MARNPVPVAFACPFCVAPQEAGLIEVSRAGFHRCSDCGRKLSPSQVSHALHAGPPIRAPRAPTGFDALPGARTRLLR